VKKEHSLIEQIKALQSQLANVKAEVEELGPVVDSLQDVDTETIEFELQQAEARNKLVRANEQAAKISAEVGELHGKWEWHNQEINAIEAIKTKLVSDAKFPIPELGFSPDSVTYQGVDFDQASDAEQIRVSAAIGLALHPMIKILRIKQGGLVDEDGVKLLEQIAEDLDGQIWFETTWANTEGPLFKVEDGEVEEVQALALDQKANEAEEERLSEELRDAWE
jgi:hypothetical protein